jgi:muramidase (phage lysozyme)
MPATNAGFSVRISAVDAATATLDKINKRIAAMSAPAERFNKSMAKFGDVSGITKLSEGMSSLGHNALDTFRSVERIVSPMAAITGAGSIAGMTLLVQRWAELGTQVSQTSYRLAMPAQKLTNLEGAARLAGSSAEALDSSLSTLREELSGAVWGRDPHAIQVLRSLNINPGTPSHVKDTAEALGELADRIKGMPDVHTQQRALDELGLDRSLLPLLKNGKKGLEDLTSQAKQLGGGMTDEMAKNADDTRKSFTKLSEAIEGVANRMADRLSPTAQKYMDQSSDWISKNKQLADSFAAIGTAIATIGTAALGLKWLIGRGGLLGSLGGAILGEEMLYQGTKVDPTQSQADENAQLGGSFSQRFPDLVVPNTTPLGPVDHSQPGWFMRNWRKWNEPGPAADVTLDPASRGFLDTIAGPESGGDYQLKNGGSRFSDISQFPEGVGPGGTSTASGRYQFVSGTWRSVSKAIGAKDFGPESQDKGAWYLAETAYRAKTGRDLRADLKEGGHEAGIADALKEQWPSLPGGTQQLETLDQFKTALGRHTSSETAAAAATPGAGAAAASGHVQVDVTVKHDGSSATSKVTTQGQVSATPPRVERSMAMVP